MPPSRERWNLDAQQRVARATASTLISAGARMTAEIASSGNSSRLGPSVVSGVIALNRKHIRVE